MADTDSVFVSGLENKEMGDKLEKFINEKYDIFAADNGLTDHRLRIEFEEYTQSALIVKKKRYAMKREDGSYKIAGFQLKRSDTQELTKEVQETILHDILSGTSKKEIRNYYHDIKDAVLSGDHNPSIGIPRKFTKDLEHYADSAAVRGAYYSNEYLKTHIGAGDKCLIYHVKRVIDQCGYRPFTDAIAIESDGHIPDKYIIDLKKHWERINKALYPLLDDLDILENTKQVSMEDFL